MSLQDAQVKNDGQGDQAEVLQTRGQEPSMLKCLIYCIFWISCFLCTAIVVVLAGLWLLIEFVGFMAPIIYSCGMVYGDFVLNQIIAVDNRFPKIYFIKPPPEDIALFTALVVGLVIFFGLVWMSYRDKKKEQAIKNEEA